MYNRLVRYSLAALLALQCAYLFAEDDTTIPGGTVNLEVSGLQSVSGDIYIAVYDSEDDWLGDDTVLQKKVVISDALEGELVLTQLQLPLGQYAISIFFDVNNNGELDTNFIGIPKEPVALSNNARPKFGPPKYKDAVFSVGSEPVVQRIAIESI